MPIAVELAVCIGSLIRRTLVTMINSVKKYKLLVQRALEKIPFINYIQRLKFFIANPDIEDTYAHQQQREYSFVDLFNGLGLLTVLVSLVILYDRAFNEFKIVLAFNPLFIVISWVSNAVVFSICSSILLTLFLRISKSPRKYEVRDNFYNLLTHGLRCYAVFGLFLGLVFVKACGAIFLDGLTLNQALSAWYWQAYILAVLGFFLLRLVVNPYYRYCSIVKNKAANWLLVAFLFSVSFEPLKLLPFDYSEKLMNKTVLCELFKKGDFIKLIPKHLQAEAISKVCTVI